ncbi:MAG: exodeoxyribonuclease VII large subunit [Myxococcaceae bacterium]|jgi:exodeoxyribonuclease VII large subunit|nr:exodeoxyribonuclease VII large subunit [Myxococcaceae bacterium]
MKQADLFGGPVPSAGRPEASRAAVERDIPPPDAMEALPNERPEPVPAWRRPREAQARKVLSVSELTFQLKESIEPRFARVLVRGEVTGFRGPNTRGHLYFAIKDEGAQLDVRIWQSMARTLKFQLRDGLSLIIEGGLNVYEPQGRYSLIAQRVEPEGVGAMALAFEQLKAKLTKEGLIGEGRTKPRRPLPTVPRRIGVVTSASGAAWRDFMKVLHRRHPRLPVLLCDARVQGEDAAVEIARALRWLSKTDVDLIVVTRGGGSVEDLWTFNEERVVRAIFASPVPVVSAVGHEIDVTLADLVADHRAPTPSAAAELVAPVLSELEHRLEGFQRRLTQAARRKVLEARHRLQTARGALGDPRRQLTSRRLRLAELGDGLRRGVERPLRRRQKGLGELSTRLARSRPQARLGAQKERLSSLSSRARAALGRQQREARATLHRLRLSLERTSPRPRLRDAGRDVSQLKERLPQAMRRRLVRDRATLAALVGRLEALSPLAVLGRGYALVRRPDGGPVVRRAAEVAAGDPLTIRLDRGDVLEVRVEATRTGEE